MPKSPTSTTLPALSRSSNNNSSQNSDAATATGFAPMAGEGTAAIDYVALYRQYCAEEGCKANSALVRYIQDRGGHFNLERLNLSHNYLGSRGLRPVLRIIDQCQTIVSINLEDNGIDNDAVADLCAVLERHVSIASLNLRRNPISVVGGKRLLQLVEANPRMTKILMDGTDIFEGLQERIRMALQHNVAVAQGSGLQMEANKEENHIAPSRIGVGDESRAFPQVKVSTASTLPLPKASLQPIHGFSGTLNGTAAGDVATTAATAAASPYGKKFVATADASVLLSKDAATETTTSALSITTTTAPMPSPSHTAVAVPTSQVGWQEATLGRTRPRPPPPAVCSYTTKALPKKKVIDLKALFAEQARLHTEVNRGEASRRAYAVREELQALERHGRPVVDAKDGTAVAAAPTRKVASVNQTYPGASPSFIAINSATATTTTFQPLPPLRSAGSSISDHNKSTSSAERSQTSSPSAAGQTLTKGEATVGDVLQNSNTAPATTTALNPSISDSGTLVMANATTTEDNGDGGAVKAAASSPSQQVAFSSDSRPLAHTVEDVLSPSRVMLLTMEEQFTVFFDQGCREYLNRNLDAAYMAWNEAMRLAVSEGQREWMAVVASNLQRLSYELLVEEGTSHLKEGELEKASEAFDLALEVAVKAKNAVWVRDVRLAKQNVQKALFHRCHEAALLLFSRAQEGARVNVGGDTENDKNNEVTENDYFILPGTEEMVRHTPDFVREWSCLLLLKEAIGLWVEATRVVARLSDVAAAPLQENINEALNLVASFIVQRHFNDTAPAGLLWFHTDAYLYHECVLLSDLWYDLVADSEQSLHHPLLSAVCATQLGELYVATFQLPQALVQFDKLIRYGHVHKSPVLEATGLTLCGRVQLQRANHALAETALEAALELWAEVQSDPVVKQLIGSPTVAHDILAPMDTSAITTEMMTTTKSTTPLTAASAAAGANTPNMASTTTGAGDAPALASTLNADGAHHGSPRFRVEAHLPPDAISVLASACRHCKVCLLLQTYRYRDALETLEYSLNVAYCDMLQEKLNHNFHLNPSLDEIAAIAGVLQTSLVFYTLTSRYDWSATQNAYQAEESLCMWVLAESREMRFVEVNLTNNFRCSMQDLLSSLRQRLCVEPEMALQSEIITELPSRSWQEPLRVLYQACIHPIIGYVRAADPHMLFGDGVITVVPVGLLWLVPFHALLNVKAGDRYLVEEVAIQLAFSATQAAFASLSAEQVRQRDLHREVVAVQRETDHGMMDSMFYSAFPFNADRSTREGEGVAALLRAGQAQVAERQLKKTAAATTAAAAASSALAASSTACDSTTVLTHKVEIVENVEALRAVLPWARTLHIATSTTAAPSLSLCAEGGVGGTAAAGLSRKHLQLLMEERGGRCRPEDEGGLLMITASPMGDIGIVRAAEIAHMNLFAEHVILTNTNMSREHVGGVRDDVLGLVRSFFGSGVPCVIAGQWCTPDMEPMELFQHFYTLWCRPPATSSDVSLRTVLQTTATSGPQPTESRASESTGESVSTRAEPPNLGNVSSARHLQHSERTSMSNNYGNISEYNVGDEEGGEDDEGEVVRHRALLLARSIRRLLAEEPTMRYRPRVWAGYYCMGTGW